MLTKTLPMTKTHGELFFNYMHSNESFGLATIDKNMLHYDTICDLKNEIYNFFTIGLNSNPNWENISVDNWDTYVKEYKHPIENYGKLVWLTRDYISNKSFNNPIGVHWDPTVKKWIIHPGGSRQKVIHLFHQDPLDVVAFNTGGIDLKFNKKFKSYVDLEQYFNEPELFLCVVADHGSLIPHLHFSHNTSIIKNVKEYHTKMKQFFTRYKLVANFDLKEYGYVAPKKFKHLVKIKIENAEDTDQQIRALALAPSFLNYNNYGVKIECT
jgi:hypothetical protein